MTAATKTTKQETLTAKRGTDKRTGHDVYFVLSREKTIEAGYPVYHMLVWDNTIHGWHCPCKGFEHRHHCAHSKAAEAASVQKHFDNLMLVKRGA
jgi:hypothetical protein